MIDFKKCRHLFSVLNYTQFGIQSFFFSKIFHKIFSLFFYFCVIHFLTLCILWLPLRHIQCKRRFLNSELWNTVWLRWFIIISLKNSYNFVKMLSINFVCIFRIFFYILKRYQYYKITMYHDLHLYNNSFAACLITPGNSYLNETCVRRTLL